MTEFCITTDSGCDFPASLLAEHHIIAFPMRYAIDGVEFQDRMDPADMPGFYDKMRAGAAPVTSQMNPVDFLELWSKVYSECHLPIIHIALGSAISGTYASGVQARQMFLEQHPDASVFVIDSTLASMSYGILALAAAKLRDAGTSVEDSLSRLEELKHRIQAYFTTDDLTYLHRSGRVSKASAVVASALNINPLLKLDKDGRLVVIEKIRGRKKALNRIYELVSELVINPQQQTLYICHSDCKPEELKTIADTLVARNGFTGSYVNFIGPIVGSHTGPGLVSVFFIGQPRT